MERTSKVLETAEWVAKQAVDVHVVESNLRRAAECVLSGLLSETYSKATWHSHPLHPNGLTDEGNANWIFTVDLLNYSFWPEPGQPTLRVEFHGASYTGYWALCAAINRAMSEGIEVTVPSLWRDLPEDLLRYILRGEGGVPAPLLKERLATLQAAQAVLESKYNSSFVEVIKKADHSAQAMLDILTTDFGPCFDDSSDYNGRKVYFFKRAQILIGDLWACFGGQGLGRFDDIDTLTMFADNRVPQSLQFLGLLSYSEELLQTLREETLIPHGDPYEVEIRACSIWAVELLSRELRALIAERPNHPAPKERINAVIIDYYLWDYAKRHAAELVDFPTHLTRCTQY